MESSFYHFKALTYILNVNQIHVSSDEFKILLEAIQKGNLSEVKESLSSLGKMIARVFEVEPLKAHHYYFVEWGNQAVAVTSSAEQPEIRICTEK